MTLRPIKYLQAITILFLASCVTTSQFDQKSSNTANVELTVKNQNHASSIKCLVSLAHFVTLKPSVIDPGKSHKFKFIRETPDGILYAQYVGTNLMAVENIYCGADQNWGATRTSLSLSELRQGNTDHVTIYCNGQEGTAFCRLQAED